MKALRNKQKRGGFTLIEILVVIAIMGFLVAMVAPKLAGVVSSAIDTTSDGSHRTLSNVMTEYVSQKGAIPAGLTNMVYLAEDFNSTAPANTIYALPSPTNNLTADGIEDMSIEFDQRMLPTAHMANKAETREMMVDFGMRTVSNYAVLQNPQAAALTGPGNKNAWGTFSFVGFPQAGVDALVKEKGVWEGLFVSPTDLGVNNLPVMMVGMGIDSTDVLRAHPAGAYTINDGKVTEYDANGTVDVVTATATGGVHDAGLATFAKIGDARQVGRIILGLNNGSGIVQGGMLEESGISAKQSNTEAYKWGNYLVLMPRLQATVDRITEQAALAAAPNKSTDTLGGLKIAAIGLDEDNKLIKRTPMGSTTTSDARGGLALKGQALEDISVIDPEGKTWGNPNVWMGVSVMSSSKGASVR